MSELVKCIADDLCLALKDGEKVSEEWVVRFVIERMREPTDEMVNAGSHAEEDAREAAYRVNEPHYGKNAAAPCDILPVVWRAMIDEALE